MAQFTKADLLALDNTGFVTIGDDMEAKELRVRGLTAFERDQFGMLANGDDFQPMIEFKRALVCKCILEGATGKTPMFEPGDEPDLPAMVVEPVWQRIMELSGIGESAQDDIAGN